MKNKYIISALLAGILWGTVGFFSRNLKALGFDSSSIVIIRCGFSCLFFGITMLIRDPKKFKLHLRDFWCFIGTGLCSLLFYTYCYFMATNLSSLATASVLINSAPAFVLVLSFLLFKEKLTKKKIVALVLTLVGGCLVSGILSGDNNASMIGVLYGLGAGFGYALYGIFASFALRRGYDSLTINFYSCLLAAVGAACIWGVSEPVALVTASFENLLWCVGIAVFANFVPYLCFTHALSGLEVGMVSLFASVDPVVSTTIGLLLYGEKLTFITALGIVLVLAALAILNIRFPSERAAENA